MATTPSNDPQQRPGIPVPEGDVLLPSLSIGQQHMGFRWPAARNTVVGKKPGQHITRGMRRMAMLEQAVGAEPVARAESGLPCDQTIYDGAHICGEWFYTLQE